MQIIVEEHTPGDSATLFRLQMSDRVICENLTAAQAHLLVGEILGQLVFPYGARPVGSSAAVSRRRSPLTISNASRDE